MAEAGAGAEAAAEAGVSAEDSPELTKQTESPDGDAAAVKSSADDGEIPPRASDHKRKLQDLEPDGLEEAPHKKQEVSGRIDPTLAAVETPVPLPAPPADTAAGPDAADSGPARADGEIDGSRIRAAADETPVALRIATTVTAGSKVDTKTPSLDGIADASISAVGGDGELQKQECFLMNGQRPQSENDGQLALSENIDKPPALISQQIGLPATGQQPPVSRKIEVPNNKVGVLIGKSGDTIKYLQFNSGARIQITRDTEADPLSSTRPVELTGTLENINKAEQLIRNVIAEADSGGSPSLVARGFGTVQFGGEHIEIPVPNEKAGMIIGKGGETIKNLQTRSGARVQLIPQHLPTGDTSKERIVRITGNKKQIESARDMVKEVLNQAPLRPSPLSGKYSQQSFHPRGLTSQPQWGSRATAPRQQTMGYDYLLKGTQYPSQVTQYPPQLYGGYSQQPPPRSNFSTGWDQRLPASGQTTPQTGGYDYYGQVAPVADIQSSNPMSTLPPASATPAPVNYNYGQSQALNYGHPAPYPQPGITQQNYGHGYSKPKHDNQAPDQQMYGQQPLSSQPGVYAQQTSTPQSGYSQQQPYGKPAYGAPTQDVSQSYGAPRATQPGDPMYHGQATSSYGPSGTTQQSYPYGSSAPSQPTAYGQNYGPTSGTADCYTQTSSAGHPPQHGGHIAPGYYQGGQSARAYTQPGPQSGGYGQYPPAQPSYGDQAAPSQVNYGYQGGPADGGYGSSVLSSGYSAPPMVSGQPGYVQHTTPNPSGYYEQLGPPQSGYGGMPGSAPAGYTKSLSPQPGYGGPYKSVQNYIQQ